MWGLVRKHHCAIGVVFSSHLCPFAHRSATGHAVCTIQGCARSVYHPSTARLKLVGYTLSSRIARRWVLVKENRINIALKALSAGSRLSRSILRNTVIHDGVGESVSKKANKAEIMFPYAT
jgi:hypothetical protein